MHITNNALDLPGYRQLGDAKQNKYDYLYVIEPEERPSMCLRCKRRDAKLNKLEVRERKIIDIPAHGKRVQIQLIYRRYKCLACGKTFTEPLVGIDMRARVTERLKDYVKKEAVTKMYSTIADEVGISEQTAKRYFETRIHAMRRDWVVTAPVALGIDEVYINKKPRAIITDVGNNKVLDMLEDNTKATVVAYLQRMDGKERVQVVTMDMCTTYKFAVQEVLPGAYPIIDKYHVVQAANMALNKYIVAARARVNSAEARVLWGIRRTLLADRENLTPARVERREAVFVRYPELKAAYWHKEDLRDVYQAKTTQEAYQLFYLWEEAIPKSMKHFVKVKNALNKCKPEIINYFRFAEENYTNAYTESMNRPSKDKVREGRNYKFETIRAKVLLKQRKEKKPRIGTLGFE